MDPHQDETARYNTRVLLAVLLVVFVAMIMLAVALVRIGDVNHKLDALARRPPFAQRPPLPQKPPFAGGDVFFRV